MRISDAVLVKAINVFLFQLFVVFDLHSNNSSERLFSGRKHKFPGSDQSIYLRGLMIIQLEILLEAISFADLQFYLILIKRYCIQKNNEHKSAIPVVDCIFDDISFFIVLCMETQAK